jgi:hypothetical protein
MVEFDVSLLVSASHSFFDGSGVLRGLSDLNRARTIRLKLSSGGVFDPRHHGLIRFDVATPDGSASRRVVVDVTDQANRFCVPALNEVDIYFKRSFSRQCIELLAIEHQRRVRPYGLNIACLGMSAARWHMGAAALVLGQRVAQRKPLVSALSEFIGNCRLATGLPGPAAFRAAPGSRAERIVILQSRIWPPEESAEDLQRVNDERIAIVRTLKSAFGSDFVGGIVADPFSESVCPPEVLVRQNKRRGAYLKLVTSATIGVYVRGLHNAIAIKMAEYLAAGLCIVSEPIQFEVHVPLVAGVNYLVFRSEEECVSQCEWLLSHPAEAERMRAANLDYYAKWVEPQAHVYELLARAFAPHTRTSE